MEAIVCVRVALIMLSMGTLTLAAKLDYSENIKFDVFTDKGNITLTVAELSKDLVAHTGCDPTGKLAFVVPGWMDDGDEQWVLELVSNYQQFRGGCVCVMKYGYYALDLNYFEVIRNFEGIADVLKRAIKCFLAAGFHALLTYMFGFSLGARLAMYAAANLKPIQIAQLDCCDPAGFGFDGHKEHTNFAISDAARLVCCMHTSTFFGTRERRCDIDWNLGECGKKQVAARGVADSHKLCTQFWNSAFVNEFPAVTCDEQKCGRNERDVCLSAEDDGYLMGYQEDCDYPNGIYCANTFKYPPYNNASARAVAGKKMEW